MSNLDYWQSEFAVMAIGGAAWFIQLVFFYGKPSLATKIGRKMKKSLLLLFAVLLSSLAFGQTIGGTGDTGTFGAADVHEVDTIDLFSLNVELNIPLVVNRPGAIPFRPTAIIENHCQKNPAGGGTYKWDCVGPWIQAGTHIPTFGYTYVTTVDGCNAGALTYGTWAVTEPINSAGNTTSHAVTGTVSTCSGTPASLTASTTDNSGYTLKASWDGTSTLTITVTDRAGDSFVNTIVNGVLQSFSNLVTDPFSNSISSSYNGMTSTTTYTDTLGSTFTEDDVSATTVDFGYTDTTGTARTVAETAASTGTTLTGSTQCSATSDQASLSVKPFSFSYPDGTSISTTVETDQGRVGTVTLRTGGTITYTYGSPLTCPVSKPSFPSSLTRATADGTTTYTLTTQTNGYVDTVVDPGKNKVVYYFSGSSFPLLTEVQRYQNTGSVGTPAYTLISQTIICYNGTTPASSCPNAAYSTTTITQKDTYEYVGTGPTFMSQRTNTYDSYGNVLTDVVADQITSQTITTTYVYGTYSSGSCSAITNTAIHDHPCTVTTKTGTTWLSGSTYTYNSNGALTSSSTCLTSTCTGSSALTTAYTRNSTGTPATITLPNSTVITNTFGSCNSLLLTDSTVTVTSVAIDNKQSWNCNAGVVTDTTDPNSNEDDYAYDSMNRLSSYTDRLENVTSYAYGTPTLDHVKVTDPLSVVSYVYNDGLGRPTNSQVCQTTGCSNLDTSSTAYAWNGTNFETTTYVPCVKTTLNSACTTVALTADVNPIAGFTKSTDANSGTLTGAVNSKDFSITAGPAPSQENTKVLQTESDGFGRVTSTCALTSTGYNGRVSCGQTMGNSGTLTSNVYSFATGAPKVVTTRGSQSHTTIADAVGRTTSVQTPEGGTVTYTYDSATTTNCTTQTSAGALLEVSKSGSSIYNCYHVDDLQRITDIKNTTDNATNPCRRFRYDSTASKFVTAPTGYPATPYIIGRLFEAETDDCAGTPTTQTDEWFAYDKMGRITDMWESTPNSSGYYHTTVVYDADGTVTSLSGIPSSSTITIGVDGEDRPFNFEYGTTWIVGSSSTTGVSYDAASRPLTVPLPSSGDGDTYTYDNVGNMTEYTFSANSTTDDGKLTWNSIGSLNKLVITDGFNSGGSQTCTYGTSTVEGYDDVGRLLDANCGSLIQHDSWTYDQYDNANRTGNPGTSWSSSYSSTNNQFTLTGATYDSDGNVTYDGVNSYSWNAYGKMVGAVSGNHAISCTSGNAWCSTYDAFGQLVETFDPNGGGVYYQTLLSPIGRVAAMSGQSVGDLYIPTPGGGVFYRNASTNYFSHPDWLGSTRLITSISGRTSWSDTAFTPYGESYDSFGTVSGGPGGALNFTGDTQWSNNTSLFDTPNRELFVNSSRWLSPDPAHASWNAYSYPTDPNTQTDPSGLRPCGTKDDACVTASPDPVATSSFFWGEVYGCIGGCRNANLIFRSPKFTPISNTPIGTSGGVGGTGQGVSGPAMAMATLYPVMPLNYRAPLANVGRAVATLDRTQIMANSPLEDKLWIANRAVKLQMMGMEEETAMGFALHDYMAADPMLNGSLEQQAGEMAMSEDLATSLEAASVAAAAARTGGTSGTVSLDLLVGGPLRLGSKIAGPATVFLSLEQATANEAQDTINKAPVARNPSLLQTLQEIIWGAFPAWSLVK